MIQIQLLLKLLHLLALLLRNSDLELFLNQEGKNKQVTVIVLTVHTNRMFDSRKPKQGKTEETTEKLSSDQLQRFKSVSSFFQFL